MTLHFIKKGIFFFLALTGAFFLVAVLAIAVYIGIKKPFGIKLQNIPSAIVKATSGNVTSTYDHPLLTTEQESTLESLGVDTKKLPTTLTPELIACFTVKLGEARVKEIEAGATITPADYLKGESCIQ